MIECFTRIIIERKIWICAFFHPFESTKYENTHQITSINSQTMIKIVYNNTKHKSIIGISDSRSKSLAGASYLNFGKIGVIQCDTSEVDTLKDPDLSWIGYFLIQRIVSITITKINCA